MGRRENKLSSHLLVDVDMRDAFYVDITEVCRDDTRAHSANTKLNIMPLPTFERREKREYIRRISSPPHTFRSTEHPTTRPRARPPLNQIRTLWLELSVHDYSVQQKFHRKTMITSLWIS